MPHIHKARSCSNLTVSGNLVSSNPGTVLGSALYTMLCTAGPYIHCYARDEMPGETTRSLLVSGRRTSVRLHVAFWAALHEIAAIQNRTIHDIATELDPSRDGLS